MLLCVSHLQYAEEQQIKRSLSVNIKRVYLRNQTFMYRTRQLFHYESTY